MGAVADKIRNEPAVVSNHVISDITTPFFRNQDMWVNLESRTMLAWRIKEVIHRRIAVMRV